MPDLNTSTHRISQHRQKLRDEGLRPVQFWVPDTRRADFAAIIQRQCRALTNDPAEADILNFTQEAATSIEGWQ